ncbi:MAG: phage baseplate assembly protein V [Treponema sp.]|nr:phage baseplate assembly protein V [Treponema sp.]
MTNPLFMAKVSDNKDPDGLNRIRITFTDEDEVVSNWVPYVSPLTGDGTGISVLPDVDDEVLVASLGTEKSYCVVIGSVWSEAAAAPETGENSDADLNQDGKNSLTFIKTKGDNMLILDDTEGKEKIQIIHNKTNSRVEFLAEDKKISVTTDEEIALTSKKDLNINAENISIEAEKELNFQCEDLQIKASKEVNIEASKDMTLKGSGIALN